jgi:hypothetical protein
MQVLKNETFRGHNINTPIHLSHKTNTVFIKNNSVLLNNYQHFSHVNNQLVFLMLSKKKIATISFLQLWSNKKLNIFANQPVVRSKNTIGFKRGTQH